MRGAIEVENMTDSEWYADPLTWGHGPALFEVFLEPTCPYSEVAFGKLDELLATAGEERMTLKIRLHSQPWHMFSPVVTRAILAASTLPAGKAAAKAAMTAVYAHREEFEFEHHASGANRDATPNDIIRRIEAYSGLKLMEAFDTPDLDKEVKWHSRYARQNGVHVSPSFMVNGIVQSDLSSVDSVADWLARL
jgi:protein-disulfide isomerase